MEQNEQELNSNQDSIDESSFSDENIDCDDNEKLTIKVTQVDNDDTNVGNIQDKKPAKKKKKKAFNYWPFVITGITFCLSLIFSFVSELATQDTGSLVANVIIAIVLLILLIITSIIFDGIGVSVTSCNLAPLNSMAARKVPHAKIAIMLVKNASRVNNICADVIGDICGIVSGACGASLVVSIMAMAENIQEGFWISIFVSAFIAAFTVGGKAFEKTIAIKKSQELVMMTARVIGIFYHPDKKRKKNAGKDK